MTGDGDDLQVGIRTRHEVDRLRHAASVVGLGEILEDLAARVGDDEQPMATRGPGGHDDVERAVRRLAGGEQPLLPMFADDAIVAVADHVVGREDDLLAPGAADAGAGALIGDRPVDREPGGVADDLLRCADRGDRQVGPWQLVDAGRLRLLVVPSIAVVDAALGVGGDDELMVAAQLERQDEFGAGGIAGAGREPLLMGQGGEQSAARPLDEMDAVEPVAGNDRAAVFDPPFDAHAVAGTGEQRRQQAGDAQVGTLDAQRRAGLVVVLGVAFVDGVVGIAAHQPAVIAVGEPAGQRDGEVVGDAILRCQAGFVVHGGDLEQPAGRAAIDVDAVPPACRAGGESGVAQRVVQRRGIAGPQGRRRDQVAGNQVGCRLQVDPQALGADEQIVLEAPRVARRLFVDAAAGVDLQQHEILAAEVTRQEERAAAAVALAGSEDSRVRHGGGEDDVVGTRQPVQREEQAIVPLALIGGGVALVEHLPLDDDAVAAPGCGGHSQTDRQQVGLVGEERGDDDLRPIVGLGITDAVGFEQQALAVEVFVDADTDFDPPAAAEAVREPQLVAALARGAGGQRLLAGWRGIAGKHDVGEQFAGVEVPDLQAIGPVLRRGDAAGIAIVPQDRQFLAGGDGIGLRAQVGDDEVGAVGDQADEFVVVVGRALGIAFGDRALRIGHDAEADVADADTSRRPGKGERAPDGLADSEAAPAGAGTGDDLLPQDGLAGRLVAHFEVFTPGAAGGGLALVGRRPRDRHRTGRRPVRARGDCHVAENEVGQQLAGVSVVVGKDLLEVGGGRRVAGLLRRLHEVQWRWVAGGRRQTGPAAEDEAVAVGPHFDRRDAARIDGAAQQVGWPRCAPQRQVTGVVVPGPENAVRRPVAAGTVPVPSGGDRPVAGVAPDLQQIVAAVVVHVGSEELLPGPGTAERDRLPGGKVGTPTQPEAELQFALIIPPDAQQVLSAVAVGVAGEQRDLLRPDAEPLLRDIPGAVIARNPGAEPGTVVAGLRVRPGEKLQHGEVAAPVAAHLERQPERAGQVFAVAILRDAALQAAAIARPEGEAGLAIARQPVHEQVGATIAVGVAERVVAARRRVVEDAAARPQQAVALA
ncbi:MAG: hypothetical protein FAZ92_02926 [Accumulibacter sp.]|nr:MAG: hypothetical protein FAZ92_02926 [Accumulibacter sp.]